jgi:hypothetical protein
MPGHTVESAGPADPDDSEGEADGEAEGDADGELLGDDTTGSIRPLPETWLAQADTIASNASAIAH